MKYLIIAITFIFFSCSQPQEENIATINDVYSPANEESGEPVFFKAKGSNIGLSWLEKEEKRVALKYAIYKNSNWTEPKTLVSGDKILTNWADFPGIVTNGKHWIAWFLQMNNPDTFAYDVMVMQSSDEGENWTVPKRIHSDSTLTEHGFVSAVPSKTGFQLMWLDGRLVTEENPIFTVRTAHIDFEGIISNRNLLDDNTCTCCQTSMLNTGDDNFIALYRNRTEEEIRDIAAVNFNNAGEPALPQIIYADEWHIPGCPVNGPRSVMNENELGIAWFTMGKDGVAKVQFATSNDKGNTYSPPILIDSTNLGRVDVLVAYGSYFISYMDNDKTGAEIKIVEVKDNKIVNTFSITKVSTSRKTGFPRMALSEHGTGIYVAYTDVETKKVEMKFLLFE